MLTFDSINLITKKNKTKQKAACAAEISSIAQVAVFDALAAIKGLWHS